MFTVSQYCLKGAEIIYWEMTDFDLRKYSMTNRASLKIIAF